MNIDRKELAVTTFETAKSGFGIPNNNGVSLLHTPSGIVVESSRPITVHANLCLALRKLEKMVEAWEEQSNCKELVVNADFCALEKRVAKRFGLEKVSNSSAKERTEGKPHIVKIAGHWRVLTWKRNAENEYTLAPVYINRLNTGSEFYLADVFINKLNNGDNWRME